jgi:hexosaminidase
VAFEDDPANWIFAPTSVTADLSVDGVAFAAEAQVKIAGRRGLPKPLVRSATPPIIPGQARYLRLHVKNLGVCPPGHAGAGEKAWLFLSDIRVLPPQVLPVP